jgi:iron-sulfur cluster assembly protein
VKGGGCGVTLIIGFDKKKETDHAYFIDDIPVYVDRKHTMFIIGKEVDFYEGEDARGFVFRTPNIKQGIPNDEQRSS